MSIDTNSGTFGAGASAKALDASAPMVMELYNDVTAQKILEPVWSSDPAYVSASVTDPVILFEPLQTQQAFLVPQSFIKYVHNNGSRFAPFGCMHGFLNVPCE